LKCLPVDVSHLSFACRSANELITRLEREAANGTARSPAAAEAVRG
jgi:hypothetical protein